MDRRGKVEKIKAIEKKLSEKIKDECESKIVLCDSDFHKGKLSFAGYNRLKQECEYINNLEYIEIIVPKEFSGDFMKTLENMVAKEVLRIKKDMRGIYINSVVFLLIGVFWFTVGNVFEMPIVIKEIMIIATWVFVWTAFDKWFFEGNTLIKRKSNLYQLLLAKVTVAE